MKRLPSSASRSTSRVSRLISSITSDLDALAIRRDPQEGTSDSFQVDVKLAPAMLHPGELHVHTSDPAFPEFVVPVSGSIR